MATINHKTYNEATETFKDFSVYDGKETLIFKVDGADQTVYASNIIGSGIIKTSDNGPLSATAKYLSDGLGNDSTLSLSTAAASIAGTLAVTGAATLSSTLSVGADTTLSGASGDRTLKIQTNTTGNPILNFTAAGDNAGTIEYVRGSSIIRSTMGSVKTELVDGTGLIVTGNVGIGTSAPAGKLDITGGNGNQLVLNNAGERFTQISFSNNSNLRAAVWADETDNDFVLYAASGRETAIYANAAERVRITTTGNVGIGTSAPTTAKLQIRGTGNTDATNSIFADNSSGAATFAVRDNGDVFMLGNVGIGTGTPTGKLHISGDGAAANLIRLQNTGAGTNGFFDISVTSTDAQLVANYSTTAIPMLFLTGAAERMRITSTGRVGIGTTADYSFNDDAKLAVANTSGNSTISIVSGTGSTGYLAFADGTSGTDRYTGSINYLHASDAMTFNTNAGNERMRITSAGNVGIGTSTPAAKLDVNQTNQSGDNDFIRLTTDATSGSLSLGIYPSSNNSLSFIGSNALFSSGGVTRLNAAAGGSLLSMNTDSIVAYVSSGAANPVERMRITSAGNVGIGTSTPVSKLHVSGADAWMTLQRTSGTTNILDFTDSAAARLGYVGFIFSNLTLNAKAGSDIVFAPNNEERGRFTSNGLTFNGDTAAANALDDYEEGTWTPSVAFGGASVGLTYGRRGGTYTKIGRQVTVCGDLILSAKGSSTGNATIAGLPFTINGSSTDFLQAASFRFAEMSFSGLVQGYGGVSSTIINMEQVTSGAGAASITDADFEDGTQLMVSLTYFV
jgi:hypothetical protein